MRHRSSRRRIVVVRARQDRTDHALGPGELMCIDLASGKVLGEDARCGSRVHQNGGMVTAVTSRMKSTPNVMYGLVPESLDEI